MAVSRKGIPDGSRRLVPRKASARSRVSNGAEILADLDGRSAVDRRYRDITAQIVADMGGASQCAEAPFSSFVASRLQPFLRSRWKHDWQTATRSTSQIMPCCHRPWCVLAQRTTLAEKVSHCGVAKLRFLVAVAFQTSPAQAIQTHIERAFLCRITLGCKHIRGV